MIDNQPANTGAEESAKVPQAQYAQDRHPPHSSRLGSGKAAKPQMSDFVLLMRQGLEGRA
jgi:hypothetical protein